MTQVSLDTSFLISFADPSRANHRIAVEYYRYCLAQNIPMWISVVAAGEFEVKQPIGDLPLQNFQIQPYNLPHAIRAARLLNRLRSIPGDAGEDRRAIILNDLKIVAQADEEGIPILLSEDRNTLLRMTERLNKTGDVAVRVLLLAEGFAPERLTDPDVQELSFGKPIP